MDKNKLDPKILIKIMTAIDGLGRDSNGYMAVNNMSVSSIIDDEIDLKFDHEYKKGEGYIVFIHEYMLATKDVLTIDDLAEFSEIASSGKYNAYYEHGTIIDYIRVILDIRNKPLSKEIQLWLKLN